MLYDTKAGREIASRETKTGYGNIFSISPDEKHCLIHNNNKLILVSSNDLNILKILDINTAFPNRKSFRWFSLANNGIASITAGSEILLYDLLNDKEILRYNQVNLVERMIISPDAKWLISTKTSENAYYYKVENGALILVNNDYKVYNATFNPYNSNEVYYIMDGVLTKANSMNLAPVSTWDLGNSGFNIDWENKLLFTHPANIYSLNSMEKIYSEQAETGMKFLKDDYIFFNNTSSYYKSLKYKWR